MTEDLISTLLGWVVLFVFLLIYPKFMLSQLLAKLEQRAQRLEGLSKRARLVIMRKLGKRDKETELAILGMQNFVVIEPSSLDPFGIVKKLDSIFRTVERRFDAFVNEIARGKSKKEKREINFALRAAIGVHAIAKLVRHYVELIKKFRNLQLAILLQMQLPMIERIAKSNYAGVEAFAKGLPIGDGIGALVAASFMKGKVKEIAKDVVCCKTKIAGRTCYVIKAHGPEPSLGRIDEAISKLVKRRKIAKIITIDASTKLEGEKSGDVARGVGFAMGGYMRELIENLVLPRKIELDAIVVKVGVDEAITPMKSEIASALSKARKLVLKSVKETKQKGAIIIAGIGNSCGIANNARDVERVLKLVKRMERKKRRKSAF